MQIERSDGEIRVVRPTDEPRHRALHGLTRTLVNNMVTGVTSGFSRGLEISIVTTAKTDEEGRRLLQLLGMPFQAS
jgi:large subunit ribosomal protein L6